MAPSEFSLHAKPRLRERLPRTALLLAVLCLATVGCASTQAVVERDPIFDEPVEEAVYDPFEPVNRSFFAFNQSLDRWLLEPLAKGYGKVMPGMARRAIRRVFVNLHSPSVFVNDLLQLKPKKAGVTGARFVINTTVGVAGIWDPAERIGLERHHSDFGQTLALAGVASGPYLVIPLVGPTTARDAFGDLIDIMLQPQTYLLPPVQLLAVSGGDTFTEREMHQEALEALEEASVDFYVTLRHLYISNRETEIAGDIPAPSDELLGEDPVSAGIAP